MRGINGLAFLPLTHAKYLCQTTSRGIAGTCTAAIRPWQLPLRTEGGKLQANKCGSYHQLLSDLLIIPSFQCLSSRSSRSIRNVLTTCIIRILNVPKTTHPSLSSPAAPHSPKLFTPFVSYINQLIGVIRRLCLSQSIHRCPSDSLGEKALRHPSPNDAR